MNARALLKAGAAMPVIYFAMLVVSALLFPGFQLLERAPSELGGPTAPHPLVYNVGMMLTAASGVLGAVGLSVAFLAGRRDRWLRIFGGLASLSLLAASVGLAMAGLFPLPDPKHYGFGLTAAAASAPLLGALALSRIRPARKAAAALTGAFVLIVAALVLGAGPLVVGLAMLASVALLCFAALRHLG